MAITTRQSSAWHHGATTAWVAPTGNYVYTGGNPPNLVRQTFTSQDRIDNIGKITGLRIYTDTASPTLNNGGMYVSTGVVAPNAVTTSATKIGDWSTPNDAPFWMTLTNLNLSALLSAIGTSTAWYCYWQNNYTASRSFYVPTIHPIWEFTYDSGLIKVWNGTSWVSGTPYVWNGTQWVRGLAYIWNGTSWQIGK